MRSHVFASTQYLGDQNTLHYNDNGEIIPKLVKQWRKKSFASQYFGVSMAVNPTKGNETEGTKDDNTHWPLMMSTPSRLNGDSSMFVFRDHKPLTEEEEREMYYLLDNYQASGGFCTFEDEEISVNFDEFGAASASESRSFVVDPRSWISSEVTFSPVWTPPEKETASLDESPPMASAPPNTSGKALLEVSDSLTVESCYDQSTKMIDMSFHFRNVERAQDGLLPWLAVGYRQSEVCAMTPPEGGFTPIVVLTQEHDDDVPQAHATKLFPETQDLNTNAIDSMHALMTPLGDTEGYSDVVVEAATVMSPGIEAARSSAMLEKDSAISLHFKQAVYDKPEVMNLMYAIGTTSALSSFHECRGCFQVKITSCSEPESGTKVGMREGNSIRGKIVHSPANALLVNAALGLPTIVAALIALY